MSHFPISHFTLAHRGFGFTLCVCGFLTVLTRSQQGARVHTLRITLSSLSVPV